MSKTLLLCVKSALQDWVMLFSKMFSRISTICWMDVNLNRLVLHIYHKDLHASCVVVFRLRVLVLRTSCPTRRPSPVSRSWSRRYRSCRRSGDRPVGRPPHIASCPSPNARASLQCTPFVNTGMKRTTAGYGPSSRNGLWRATGFYDIRIERSRLESKPLRIGSCSCVLWGMP